MATERRLTGEVAVTEVAYDALGFGAGYVDAMGHRKVQVNDALGRLLRIEDPNSGTTTFTYDDAGNMLRRVDGRGVAVEYRFDGLNREIERFDPADREGTLIATEWDVSASCEVSRCPNTAGHVVVRSYPGGADFMGYDVRRRPFSIVRVIEGRTYTLETRYDNADRAVERVYPDGRTLAYDFDAASRVVRVPGVLDAVTYTPEGLMESWVRESGVVDRMSYDRRLRLTGVGVAGAGGESLQALIVGRDRAGNVFSVADGARGALVPSTAYTYDAWYRSTKVERGSTSEVMAFDVLDGVLDKGGVAYSYAGRPGAPSAVGDAPVGFDGAGSVTSLNGFEHTYDFQGRLVTSVGAAASVRSLYGADHLRVARHDDGVTHYVADDFEVRDGISAIYARIDGVRIARLESADYAARWLTGAPAAGQPTAGAAYLKRIAGDAAHELWLTAAARRMLVNGRPAVVGLHRDHVGSLVLATGEDGQVLGRRAFGTFGDEAAHTGFVDRYGFTGQEHEPHTGLIHFAHRFLSTGTGQWMSADPAFNAVTAAEMQRLPEAIARYAYVLNNPGTYVDPDGLARAPGGVPKQSWIGRKLSGVAKWFRSFGKKPSAESANPRYRQGNATTAGGARRLSSFRRSLVASMIRNAHARIENDDASVVSDVSGDSLVSYHTGMYDRPRAPSAASLISVESEAPSVNSRPDSRRLGGWFSASVVRRQGGFLPPDLDFNDY